MPFVKAMIVLNHTAMQPHIAFWSPIIRVSGLLCLIGALGFYTQANAQDFSQADKGDLLVYNNSKFTRLFTVRNNETGLEYSKYILPFKNNTFPYDFDHKNPKDYSCIISYDRQCAKHDWEWLLAGLADLERQTRYSRMLRDLAKNIVENKENSNVLEDLYLVYENLKEAARAAGVPDKEDYVQRFIGEAGLKGYEPEHPRVEKITDVAEAFYHVIAICHIRGYNNLLNETIDVAKQYISAYRSGFREKQTIRINDHIEIFPWKEHYVDLGISVVNGYNFKGSRKPQRMGYGNSIPIEIGYTQIWLPGKVKKFGIGFIWRSGYKRSQTFFRNEAPDTVYTPGTAYRFNHLFTEIGMEAKPIEREDFDFSFFVNLGIEFNWKSRLKYTEGSNPPVNLTPETRFRYSNGNIAWTVGVMSKVKYVKLSLRYHFTALRADTDDGLRHNSLSAGILIPFAKKWTFN